MRQAGRYMPEYRRVRAQHDFLEMCRRPEIAAEVTVTAVERLGVDAAIIFADILLPLIPMEVGLRYEKGDGPMIDRPMRSDADLERIPPVDVAALGFVGDAIRMVRRALADDPAHRICRRAIHAGVVSDRGRRVAPIPGDQDHDVHPARDLASPDGDAGARDRGLSEDADRGGRRHRTAFRQLGRQPWARRLSPLRSAAYRLGDLGDSRACR